jgi:hypothetical protein
MKTIISKYVGPTGLRGSRYRATDGDTTVIIDHDPAWNSDRCHAEAVRKLCAKMGWHGELVSGTMSKRGQVIGEVWVWVKFGHLDSRVIECAPGASQRLFV